MSVISLKKVKGRPSEASVQLLKELHFTAPDISQIVFRNKLKTYLFNTT